MRLRRTFGVLVLSVVVSSVATWALDDYQMSQDLAQRPHGFSLSSADRDRSYSRTASFPATTDRTRFEHALRVRTRSGQDVSLDFSRGKHIVLFAGCT